VPWPLRQARGQITLVDGRRTVLCWQLTGSLKRRLKLSTSAYKT
jgi:hypothetical protein